MQQPSTPVRSWMLHTGLILAGLIICALYFYPQFSGKSLSQNDIRQFRGAAHEIEQYREETGEEALWTRAMFGGMPAYQISTLYPNNWVTYIDKVVKLGLPYPAGLIFGLFAGMYLLLVILRARPVAATAGALAYAFSSYFLIALEAGHHTKLNALSYAPAILAGVFLAYRGRYIMGFALTALALALEINANHLQITYYLALMMPFVVVHQLFVAIKGQKVREFGIATAFLIAAAGLSVVPNVSRLWTTYEYSKETIRGNSELSTQDGKTGLDKEYAFAWSYGKAETFTLLIPRYMGGSSAEDAGAGSDIFKELKKMGVASAKDISENLPTYWGDQPFTSGPVYAGAVICFLFILGMMLGDRKYTVGLAIAGGFFLLMSWGRNFPAINYLLFDTIPFMNKLRAPAMALVIPQLVMPIIAILGLEKVLSTPEDQRDAMRKKVLIAAGFTLGLTVLGYLYASMQSFSGPGDEQLAKQNQQFLDMIIDERKSMLLKDTLRSLMFIAASGGVLWFFGAGNARNKMIALLSIAVLSTMDLTLVDSRYLSASDFKPRNKVEEDLIPLQADQVILQDKQPGYRVLSFVENTFNNTRTAYFHDAVGGYHAAKLKRYQELIETYINPEMQEFVALINAKPTDSTLRVGLEKLGVLNMLNTKYIILNEQFPLTNIIAYGPAWVVRNVKVVANADEELSELGKVYLRTTAVVDTRFSDQVKDGPQDVDSTAFVKLEELKPNYLKYSTGSSKPATVVFSEIYYDKGWKAYVDGNEVPYFRCNYVLRGMSIPAGNHVVEWKFEPASYTQGETISLMGSLLLLLVVGGALFLEYRKKPTVQA